MNGPDDQGGRAISLKRRVFSIPTLISFSIAAMFLLLLATRFNIDWSETADILATSDVSLYLLAFASYYFGFLLRGLRWRIMLSNANVIGPDTRNAPSALTCGVYVFMGWFANAVTWFRLGDAYRAYVFTEDTGASFPRTIGTVLAERVLDVVMVFILLVLAASAVYSGGNVSGIPLFLGIAAVLVFVGLGMLVAMKQFGMHLARFLPVRFRETYDRFHQGTMESFKQLPILFVLSLLVWFTEVGRLYFVIQALDLSGDVTFALVLFVTLANAMLTTVPITPGGLGIVEPGILGLLALSLPRSEALSVALLDRSISYLSIVILGGVVFLLFHLSRSWRRKRVSGGPTRAGELPTE